MADSTIPFIQVKFSDKGDITSSVKTVSVEDNDRLIDKATIVLDDAHGAAVNVPAEGQTVQVSMGWGGEATVLFQGLVTGVPAHAPSSGVPTVTITALDPSCQMNQANARGPAERQNPKTRDFPLPGTNTIKLSALLPAIVKPYGIAIGQIKCDLDPEFTQTAPARQVNKSDWEFIQDLADAYAARAYVEYNDGAPKFYFQPESTLLQGNAMGTLEYCHGRSQLVEFKYQRNAAGAAAQQSAAAVDPSTGTAVTSPPAPPLSPEQPTILNPDTRATLNRVDPGQAAQIQQALQVGANAAHTPADQRPAGPVVGGPSDPGFPNRVTRRDPTRILGFAGEGTAIGTVKLRAKGKVTINGIATWAEGDWYVHRATHIFNRVIESTPDPRTKLPIAHNRSTYQTKFVVTR